MNFKINLLTQRWGSLVTALGLISLQPVFAATPVTLFEDHFTGGIPGWTAVQPAGGLYIDGPMLWVYDAVSDSYSEQSNLYTDGAGLSVTRIAPMLINDAVVPGDFAFTARFWFGLGVRKREHLLPGVVCEASAGYGVAPPGSDGGPDE